MAPNGATFICDHHSYKIFHTKWARKANNGSMKTPAIQIRKLAVSRGEFISFLSIPRSYQQTNSRETQLSWYEFPTVLSGRVHSGYTVADHVQDPLRPQHSCFGMFHLHFPFRSQRTSSKTSPATGSVGRCPTALPTGTGQFPSATDTGSGRDQGRRVG